MLIKGSMCLSVVARAHNRNHDHAHAHEKARLLLLREARFHMRDMRCERALPRGRLCLLGRGLRFLLAALLGCGALG